MAAISVEGFLTGRMSIKNVHVAIYVRRQLRPKHFNHNMVVQQNRSRMFQRFVVAIVFRIRDPTTAQEIYTSKV